MVPELVVEGSETGELKPVHGKYAHQQDLQGDDDASGITSVAHVFQRIE
jgi:hypothetical protein